MKRVLGMGLAGLLICVGMATEAQAAAKDWKLEIRVDNQLSATAVLKGTASKTTPEYQRCKVFIDTDSEEIIRVNSTGGVATAAYGEYDAAWSFINHASRKGAEVKCTIDEKSTDITVWDTIEVVHVAPVGMIRTPIILAPERYGAQLNSWAKATIEKLGGVKSCRAFGSGALGQEKPIDCAPSFDAGSKFSVILAEKFSRGRIEVMLGDGKSIIQFGVDVCRYRPTGPLQVIVAGASSQQITLEIADSESFGRCWLSGEDITRLEIAGVDLSAQKIELGGAFSSTQLILKDLPSTLPTGIQEVKIIGTSGSVGTASIEVVPPITVGNRLTVAYDVLKLGDPYVNKYASYFSAITVNDDAVAVENPVGSGQSNRFVVYNRAVVTLPPKIPITRASPNPETGQKEMLWAVLNDNRGKVSFANTQRIEKTWYQVLRNGPEDIAFDVLKGTSGQIRKKFALLSVTHTGTKTLNDEIQVQSLEPILEIDLSLAERTRRESVPMPIRDNLVVECKSSPSAKKDEIDKASHSGSFAVESDDIKANRCVLTFAEDNAISQCSLLRNLFGPQRIATKVKGAGADGKEEQAPIEIGDPTTLRIPLRMHTDDVPVSGVYEVEASIRAEREDRIFYRGMVSEKVAAAGAMVDPRLTFRTTLRPRGNVDSRKNFRIYMTAFVPVTGLRVGAAAPELKSSTDYTNFQLVEPKLGLLMGLEAYKHALGKNTWPLQPSLQLGMNLVSLANGGFVPTLLVGGSATIPVLEEASAKLGSKLTLGAYYEFDPRVSNDYAHHFLLTLGLNVGALLSAGSR